MTESQRLLQGYVKRQIERDRALMVTRIHALPIYDLDFVKRSDVLALFTTVREASEIGTLPRALPANSGASPTTAAAGSSVETTSSRESRA